MFFDKKGQMTINEVLEVVVDPENSHKFIVAELFIMSASISPVNI